MQVDAPATPAPHTPVPHKAVPTLLAFVTFLSRIRQSFHCSVRSRKHPRRSLVCCRLGIPASTNPPRGLSRRLRSVSCRMDAAAESVQLPCPPGCRNTSLVRSLAGCPYSRRSMPLVGADVWCVTRASFSSPVFFLV